MNIYLWDISKLASDLKTRKVDSNTSFNYIVAWAIMFFLAGVLPSARLDDTIVRIHASIGLGFTIIFSIIALRINRSVDDKDFILRLVTLSLPASVKSLAVLLLGHLVYLTVRIFYFGFNLDDLQQDQIPYIYLAPLAYPIFYFFLLGGFRRLRI